MFRRQSRTPPSPPDDVETNRMEVLLKKAKTKQLNRKLHNAYTTGRSIQIDPFRRQPVPTQTRSEETL